MGFIFFTTSLYKNDLNSFNYHLTKTPFKSRRQQADHKTQNSSEFQSSMASVKHFFAKPKNINQQKPEPVMSENDKNHVFEFDESDIHSFGDHQKPSSSEAKRSISISRLRRKPAKVADSSGFDNRKTAKTGSDPVNIPDWSKILKSEYRSPVIPDDDSDEDDEEDGDTTGGRRMIPPHEYLARRRGSSFTVHEGVGGTGKGRNLRLLRNAIWEKIGFQD